MDSFVHPLNNWGSIFPRSVTCFSTRPRFSVNGWWHTSGNTSVPVVIEARPQSAADLTGGIIHSYSFLDFFFHDPDFKVPREIWCQGAVNPPSLPNLPRRFDVNLEYVNSDSTRIWGTRVSRVLHGQVPFHSNPRY